MKDLEGKVFLLTGATEGIGKAAGRVFAERGATLVVTARNGERGARVINTSSGAHHSGKIDLENIARRPSKKVGFSVYCDSKLANVLFTRVLARRLAGTRVTANCFHPGFVRTGFGMNNRGIVAAG